MRVEIDAIKIYLLEGKNILPLEIFNKFFRINDGAEFKELTKELKNSGISVKVVDFEKRICENIDKMPVNFWQLSDTDYKRLVTDTLKFRIEKLKAIELSLIK